MADPRPLIVVPDGDPETNAQIAELLDGSEFAVDFYEDVPETTEDWVQRTRNAEAIILSWGMPSEVLSSADRLKVVSFCGTGVSDHVDTDLAAERGISVRNVSGYGDNAVAEHALALLLGVLTNIPTSDRAVRGGDWPEAPRWELKGSRLGIVGIGGIGRRFAELAAACGMEVVGWSRRAESGIDPETGIRLVSLAELFAECDAVSLHLALSDQTRGLVDETLLRSMKPDSIFINTARGGLVDTDALARLLDDGAIRGAGIDVFDTEPVEASNPLLACERAVLTPHIAFNTHQASRTLVALAVQNVVDHFAGE